MAVAIIRGVFLQLNRDQADVLPDTRMRGHMITLQEQVVKAGGIKRIYDHLRHSAATEAEEMGMELEKMRHLTAHKDSTMNREIFLQNRARKSPLRSN